jgi:hypothetical protein
MQSLQVVNEDPPGKKDGKVKRLWTGVLGGLYGSGAS